jgi:hypothetical protein
MEANDMGVVTGEVRHVSRHGRPNNRRKEYMRKELKINNFSDDITTCRLK